MREREESEHLPVRYNTASMTTRRQQKILLGASQKSYKHV